MKAKYFKINSLLFLLGVVLIACSEDNSSEDNANVDQVVFLENTTQLIVGSYASFNTSVNTLNDAIDSLTTATTQDRLDNARQAMKSAYLEWQKVNFYSFGPAETVDLKSSLNIYKTDEVQIEANITSGSYNLNQIAMKDAKGFPALDYLLYASSDSIIMHRLKSNSNRCAYLKAVANDIQTKVNKVQSEWTDYTSTFKSASGTDVGSSTGQLVNTLNQHYEKFFRDNKIGVPLGVRSSGIPRPDFVEALYGGYSIELAIANLEAMKTLYEGNDGYGLDDYLIASDASELNNSIEDKFKTIGQKLNVLSDPLAQQIQNNSNQVQEVYNEMQQLIVLWKVDMPSRMGVLITYQDNDGD